MKSRTIVCLTVKATDQYSEARTWSPHVGVTSTGREELAVGAQQVHYLARALDI